MSGIKLINREELKEKLDQEDNFKLLMTMGGWAFSMGHIPGSLSVDSFEDALWDKVQKTDEIVVYCSNPDVFR